MNKVVGVTIDTKSISKNKIYYYTTNNNYKHGDVTRIKVKSGGTPKATIIVPNSKMKHKYNLKKLEEV